MLVLVLTRCTWAAVSVPPDIGSARGGSGEGLRAEARATRMETWFGECGGTCGCFSRLACRLSHRQVTMLMQWRMGVAWRGATKGAVWQK